MITVIIPLLPFYIAGIVADLAAAGTVFDTLKTFGVVLALSMVLRWVWISTLSTIAGARTGASPLSLIRNMLPAYFTALGTMSSAATIPVTLQSARNNKVREHIADFTVALMIALYMAQDSFGTACNVTGDGAIVILVDKAAGESAGSVEPVAEYNPPR